MRCKNSRDVGVGGPGEGVDTAGVGDDDCIRTASGYVVDNKGLRYLIISD